jgi:hypothetical protein
MKRIPKAIYLTAEDIEARIRELETSAMQLRPDQAEHRAIVHEIGKLRIYAEAKRWMAGKPRKQA